MNSKVVRQWMGLAVGLAGVFGGCAKPAAQSSQPPVVNANGPAPVVVQAPAQNFDAPIAAPTPNGATTDPIVMSGGDPNPKVEQRIPPSQPANVATGVDEVAKLAQAGVNEDVIVAYVDRYPGRFNVTADQIVYLNDLGVSTSVVNAMLKHDGTEAPAATAPANAAQQNVSNAPLMPVNPAPATDVQVGGNAPIATAPAAPSTETAYFYDSLAPYGSWIYVSGSGWCWQPTVAVRVASWQPYCDSGRWYWSDSGWYWQSDYSWGWAPFHYGRWYHHATCGWVWTPGTTWGPAWVSWRYSSGYCGWAPLPPAAVWAPGVGFTYYGRGVAVGFDFGLSYHHYAFVSVNNFCNPHPWHHTVPHNQVVNVYRNTTVVNNYRVQNGGPVNHGIGRETIARSNGNDFRQVKVQSASFAGGGDRMSRIERRGNDLVAYRPELPKEPTVKPAAVQSRMAQQARVARTENSSLATGGTAPRVTRNNNSVERGNTPTAPAPRGNTERVEPRNPSGTQAPRVERATPQPQQERARPNDSGRNSVARLNETTPSAMPRTETAPRVQQASPAPRAQSPANVPSPRVERQAAPQIRSVPEARNPVATAPSTPRATYMSPRYNETYGARTPGYAQPNHVNPVTPSYSAPQAPRAVTPQPQAPVARGNAAPAGGGGGGQTGGAGQPGGGHGGGGGRNQRNH